MSETFPDPLAEERAAYLEVSEASLNATLDAVTIQDEPHTPEKADRLIAAVHLMVALQTDTLVAHDRIVERAEALGVDWRTIATIREGRADLALALQRTASHLHRLDQRRRAQEPT